MKRIASGIFLLLLLVSFESINAQTLSASAKRKVTVGVDVFTDIWFNTPGNVQIRTVNPSANTFVTYNFAIGEKKTTTVAIGLGIGNHNMYSNNGMIQSIKADTITYVPTGTGLKMTKTKLSVTYLEVPLELKFRDKKGFKISVGFKLGYLLDSKEKYVGNTYVNGPKQIIKRKGISQLNTFAYSPTFRIGYKSFNLFFSYQLGTVFRVGHGPQLHPMSLGITLTPF